MSVLKSALLVIFAVFALPAATPSAFAQDTDGSDKKPNPICTVHGEGCADAPDQWAWERLEPRIGVYSVELPCNAEQADAFGGLLAISKAPFVAGSTRACMKDAAAFTSSLMGFADLRDDATDIAETTINGRRAIMNTVEKKDGYSKVAIIEVSRFGVLIIIGDIRKGLAVSREEGDALIARFFDSLEFAA